MLTWQNTNRSGWQNTSEEPIMITVSTGTTILEKSSFKPWRSMPCYRTLRLEWDSEFHGWNRRSTLNSLVIYTKPRRQLWPNTKICTQEANMLSISSVQELSISFGLLCFTVLECHFFSHWPLSISSISISAKELLWLTLFNFHQLSMIN